MRDGQGRRKEWLRCSYLDEGTGEIVGGENGIVARATSKMPASEGRRYNNVAADLTNGGELGLAIEERVVEEAGEEAAEERTNPIDALICPVI